MLACDQPFRVYRRRGAAPFDDLMAQLFGRVETVRWAFLSERLGMRPWGTDACAGVCPAPQSNHTE